MDEYTQEQLHEALRPIESLISKSEKAQGKLAPGTWQHTMLRENVQVLRYAAALMTGRVTAADDLAPDDVRAALRALASMIDKTEKAGAKFAPGTSQHTLARNRLAALRIAEALVKAELERR